MYNMQTIFITKIIRVGNSLGVLIPSEILKGYHWERGDILVFGFAGQDHLYIKKLSDKEINDLKPNEIT